MIFDALMDPATVTRYDRQVNVMGTSALVCAARGGHASIVHILLAAGACVDNKDGTITPLMSAAIAGHESVCRLLIDRKADVNTKMKGTEWTPLMFAAHNGYLSVVQVLLNSGSDANVVNVLGMMAVDIAGLLCAFHRPP